MYKFFCGHVFSFLRWEGVELFDHMVTEELTFSTAAALFYIPTIYV